jgi:hypothetical protein
MLFSIKLFQYYEQFVVRNELTFDELAFVVVISLSKTNEIGLSRKVVSQLSCVDKKLLSDSFSDIIKVNILLRLIL